jgi:hypothetical protein
MMRSKFLALGTLACIVVSAGILFAGTGSSSSSMSVGDFAVMIASRVNPEAAAKGLTPSSAVEVLGKSGVKVKSNLSSPLTEADATEIFSQFGITLQSMQPGSILDRSKASALVGTFGDSLAAKSDASSRLTSPGKSSTPATTISVETAIQDCQALPKTKDCHTCCLNLGYAHKVCGPACGNGPKASGIEPTP